MIFTYSRYELHNISKFFYQKPSLKLKIKELFQLLIMRQQKIHHCKINTFIVSNKILKARGGGGDLIAITSSHIIKPQ